MANLLELLTNALFGSACGATAGSECAAQYGQQHAWAQGMLAGSAAAQGLLGEQAARQQAFYAQAAQQANSTSSVETFYPQWMQNAPVFIKQQAEKVYDEQGPKLRPTFQEDLQRYTKAADEKPQHGYKAITLEAHEDFAAKLAARPEEK